VPCDTPSWEELRLYTDRLRLRTPTPRDADALYDLFTDPDVMHGLGKEPISEPEEARVIVEAWLAAWRTDALGPFMIETAADNQQVVGQAGLMIFDTRDTLYLGKRRNPCAARAWVGFDTAPLGPRIRDRSSCGHPGMGTRVSVRRTARLSDLVRQRPIAASRGETRCHTYGNHHPGAFGAEDSRLEASARR
jgi:hypothetical protein